MTRAYYNENDPYAAQWLRNLIEAGQIAPGDVDDRSILDVRPADLDGYTQCHFFAGIGVWSYALRRAGWPDKRTVWTGSCPCQPFSAAGKRNGFADERNLWPAFFFLISQCSPDIIFGEQVASKDGLAWLDLVQADLEGAHYASGAVDLCSAGVGSPNIRQRLWWFAERLGVSSGGGCERLRGEPKHFQSMQAGSGIDRVGDAGPSGPPVRERPALEQAGWGQEGRTTEQSGGPPVGLADSDQYGRDQAGTGEPAPRNDGSVRNGAIGGMVDTCGDRWGTGWDGNNASHDGAQLNADGGNGRPGPTNGLWRIVDWLFCRDGKWRPVEPGTFPLAHGAPARVGRLRGYGNAVNAEAAATFIGAYLDIEEEPRP